MRLSYSSDLLPLGRRVCVTARDEPLGTRSRGCWPAPGWRPTVVAGQVVLAPARTGQPSSADGHVTDRVNALDAIVVTGSASRQPRAAR